MKNILTKIVVGIGIISMLLLSIRHSSPIPTFPLPSTPQQEAVFGGVGTNLVSCWKFDESSGSAADSSGVNTNTLANQNTATYNTGKINNAAYVAKASKQYFKITDASQSGLDLSGDSTWNIWVYLQSAIGGSEEYPVIWKYNVASNKSYGFRVKNDNTIQFLATSDGSSDTAGSVTWTPSTGTWYMMTLVYNAAGGSIAFYINGSQQGTTQTGLSTSLFNGTSPFMVGQRIDGGDTTVNWDGRFDEAGVWASDLTTGNIASLYNAGAGLACPFATAAAGGSTPRRVIVE